MALSSRSDAALRWSVLAGLYASVCSVVLLSVLSPVTRAVVVVLPLPRPAGALTLSLPVWLAGAACWWALVERAGVRTYPRAALAGGTTATVTLLFWLAALAAVWSPEAVVAGGVVIGFLAAVAVPVGTVSMASFQVARRRLGAVD